MNNDKSTAIGCFITAYIIATIIIFLIPTMVNLVMSLIEDTTGYSSDYQKIVVVSGGKVKELEFAKEFEVVL